MEIFFNIHPNQIYKIDVLLPSKFIIDSFVGKGQKSFDNSLRMAQNVANNLKADLQISIKTRHE